jgi:endonuclease YncB( thermonuclease family)
MLRRVAHLLLLLLLATTWFPGIVVSQRVRVQSVPAVVDHVHDGDTLTVTVPGWPAIVSPILVRLHGIDAAELSDPRPVEGSFADLARDWLTDLLPPGTAVTLRAVRRDKYSRLLGKITASVDGEQRDVASELLRRGLARPYSGRGPKPW